jgi:prohibitin 1
MASLNKIANGLMTAGVLGLGMGSAFFFVVQPGEAKIKFNRFRGIQKQVYLEGIHFRIPFLEHMITYDVRIKPVDINSETITKDQQKIDISLRLLYRPIEEQVPNIHLSLNRDYQDKIIRPKILEVVKTILAQYDADQLLKQRDKISGEMKTLFSMKIKEYHFIVDEVVLAEIKFSPNFKKSIEDKQIAHQLAERERYVVEKNEQLFKANLIEIEGRAEAARLLSEAYRTYGDAYLKLKKLEAARKIAENMSMNPGVTFIPKSNNFLFNIS